MKNSLNDWIWLSSLPGITPGRKHRLLDFFKEPGNIWASTESELRNLDFMTEEILSRLTDKELRKNAGFLADLVMKLGIRAVTLEDDGYPYLLRKIHDPPVVLYTKGKPAGDELAVSIVGSRKATYYGLKTAENLAYELASLGITVVSGMASGIDSSAHKGALAAGGRTIAVLGCGPDIAYPCENKKLMDEIEGSGAVLSEYLPGVKPLPYNFPARNRIISGISTGVVIVEAGEHSGSLITADFAAEQGREVFAVPGNISSANSSGPNRLIRDGAKMVLAVDDILEELKIFQEKKTHTDFNFCYNKDPGAEKSGRLRSCRPGRSNLNQSGFKLERLEGDERKISGILGDEPLHIDCISRRSGLGIKDVSSALMMLEMKGIVEQLPGMVFRLK